MRQTDQRITKAIVRKIWYREDKQLIRECELGETEQPSRLDELASLVYELAKPIKDFYPVDPASPTYIVEVYNGENKEILAISGNLIMFESGKAEAIEGDQLPSFLDELLEHCETKDTPISSVIKALSNRTI